MNSNTVALSWLPWAFDVLAKSIIIITVALLAAYATRRKSAGVRHLIWRALITTIAVLPLACGIVHVFQVDKWPSITPPQFMTEQRPSYASDVPAPAKRLDAVGTNPRRTPGAPEKLNPRIQPMTTAVAIKSVDTRTHPVSRHPSWNRRWPELLLLAWLAGIIAASTQTVVGLITLIGLPHRSRKADIAIQVRARSIGRELALNAPVPILIAEYAMPMTYSLPVPHVVLPINAESWPPDRIESVLRHELAHVARGDWAIQIVARFVCALYWFNPLVWFAARRLRLEADIACDDLAVSCVAPTDYARTLLDLASGKCSANAAALPMASQTQIEIRIRSIVSNPPRRPASTVAAILTAALTLIAGLAIAGIYHPLPPAPLSLTIGPGPSLSQKMAGPIPVRLVKAAWTVDSNPGWTPEKNLSLTYAIPNGVWSTTWLVDRYGRRINTSMSTGSSNSDMSQVTLDTRGIDPLSGPLSLVVQVKDPNAPPASGGQLPPQSLDFGDLPTPSASVPTIVNRTITTQGGATFTLERLVVANYIAQKPNTFACVRYIAPRSRPDLNCSYGIEFIDNSGRDLVKASSFTMPTGQGLISRIGEIAVGATTTAPTSSRTLHVVFNITESSPSMQQQQAFHTASFIFDPMKLPGIGQDPVKGSGPGVKVRTKDITTNVELMVQNGAGQYSLRVDTHATGRRANEQATLSGAWITKVGRKDVQSQSIWSNDIQPQAELTTHWLLNGTPAPAGVTVHDIGFEDVKPAVAGHEPVDLTFDVQMQKRSFAKVALDVPVPPVGATIPVNRSLKDSNGQTWRIIDVTSYSPDMTLPRLRQEDLPGGLTESYGLIVTLRPPLTNTWFGHTNEVQTAVDNTGTPVPYHITLAADVKPNGSALDDAYVFSLPQPAAKSVHIAVSWEQFAEDGSPVEVHVDNLKPTDRLW